MTDVNDVLEKQSPTDFTDLDAAAKAELCERFWVEDGRWLASLGLPEAVLLEVGARLHRRTCTFIHGDVALVLPQG